MRRILVCREYPPTPGGGIGTYTWEAARAFARAGDDVHVIAQRWPGADEAERATEDGRLVVHRLPVEWPRLLHGFRRHPAMAEPAARQCHRDHGAAAAFAWQVSAVVGRLSREHEITEIEAPEYEAPLHFLLDDPARIDRPAVRVHLHSPSQLIDAANGLGPAIAAAAPRARLELQTIRRADRLTCPSRYLAAQVADLAAIPEDAIDVVRYPLAPRVPLERAPGTWSEGTLLFIGRLELRKGVLEWIDAAVALLRTRPGLRFAFVGSDHVDAQLGGIGEVVRRIPAPLRDRFAFHDARPRAELDALLRHARLVVVPSRWENLPYTCLEAMASGLPVVVSPEGGMAEIVRHGETGWVATSASAESLARAATEALSASADRLAAAGAEAARAVALACDPAAFVRRRTVLARAGDRRPSREERLSEPGMDAWRTARPVGARLEALRLIAWRGIRRPGRAMREMRRHLRWHLEARRR